MNVPTACGIETFQEQGKIYLHISLVATVLTACGMYQLNSIKPLSESFWFARGFCVLVFLNIFVVICFVYLRCSQRVVEI